MPCRCDNMEPTALEAYTKNTASLLLYVETHIGGGISRLQWVKTVCRLGSNRQEDADYLTEQLCNIINSLSESGKNEVVYNGRLKISRQLAEWWENHQAGEARRQAEDDLKAKKVRALNKLTMEERRVLGLSQMEI